jgi:hypothetical protein
LQALTADVASKVRGQVVDVDKNTRLVLFNVSVGAAGDVWSSRAYSSVSAGEADERAGAAAAAVGDGNLVTRNIILGAPEGRSDL